MSTISTGTSLTTGLVQTSDTTGNLVIKTGTASTTAITVDASQNVGIGTSSPAQKIDAASAYRAQIRVNSDSSNYGSSLTLAGDNGTNQSAARLVGGYQSGFGMLFQISTAGQAGFTSDPSLLTYSTKMMLDNSGNLGLGVTPSAWTFPSLSIGGQAASFAGDANTVYSQVNTYYSSGWKYVGTGYAGQYQIDRSGTALHKWYVAPSGTAGNAITFTQAMTLDASGNLALGTTTPSTWINGMTVGSGATAIGYSVYMGSGQGSLNFMTATAGGGRYAGTVGYDGTSNYMWFNTNSAERMRIDSSGNLLYNSGYGSVATAYGCRSWVNFNGTGTVAIRSSGNVSSITDNGAGNYTVNFTNAMPDSNYSVSYMSNNSGGDVYVRRYLGTLSTTGVQLLQGNASDDSIICVLVIR